MGGTRVLAAWEEPGFSTATDAQRRLPVVAGLTDWQAEHQRSGSFSRRTSGRSPVESCGWPLLFSFGERRDLITLDLASARTAHDRHALGAGLVTEPAGPPISKKSCAQSVAQHHQLTKNPTQAAPATKATIRGKRWRRWRACGGEEGRDSCGIGVGTCLVLISSTAFAKSLKRLERLSCLSRTSTSAPTARSVIFAATFAFCSVVVMVSSQSMVGVVFGLLIVGLLDGVDIFDKGIRLRSAVPLIDVVPFRLGRSFLAAFRHGATGSALVDLRNAVDPARGVGQVRDVALGAVSPAVHHAVVEVGPKSGGLLDCVLARHADGAAWPSSPAGLYLDIEGHDVRVWICGVVAALVVDRGDISGNALRDRFTKGPDQRLALLGRSLDGKGNDEAFTDAALTGRGFLLCGCCCLGIRCLAQSLAQNTARRLRAGNVAQMCRRLAVLRGAHFCGSFLGKCSYGMPE